MLTHNAIPSDQPAASSVPRRKHLSGFRNLLQKEHASWWNTRTWLVHLMVWTSLLNGFVVVLAFSQATDPTFTAMQISAMVTTFFFLLGGPATALGAVVAAQSAIVGEKQRGTAAWILSKPVSRSAFVLAKLVAQMVGFMSLAITLPSAIFYVQSIMLWGSWPDPGRFLGSVLLVMLHALWYLALTLMLGTLVRGSGAVAGIAVGGLLGSVVMQDRLTRLAVVMPWKLPAIAGLYVTHTALPKAWLPIVASVAGTLLFVAIALWGFARDEF